jgi:hypothetical protein
VVPPLCPCGCGEDDSCARSAPSRPKEMGAEVLVVLARLCEVEAAAVLWLGAPQAAVGAPWRKASCAP